MVTEPKSGSTARTGQMTRSSPVQLFQLRTHESNSDASSEPRDESGENKTKPNGESGCRGKRHSQEKKTDNSSDNFGNMMIRTNWSRRRSLSMDHTVVILCATMIWIQWMSTRCQIHVSSILLELFVHGRHKAFLEVSGTHTGNRG